MAKIKSEGDLPEDILNHPINVYLPLLESDEDNVKPEQKVKVTINAKEHIIHRGRWQDIPYFVYVNAKIAYPNISAR